MGAVATYKREKHIKELQDSAEFMRKKLIEARKAMKELPIVMPSDRGDQAIQENPAFQAYEKLIKSYQATLQQIDHAVGKERQETKVVGIVGKSKWKKQA